MKRIVVRQFGDADELQMVEEPTPEPGPGQVLVRVTSVGLNHADLMARRGQYRIASGEPPFTPGLEAGGVIHTVGPGVSAARIGERVIVGVDAPRQGGGGTYADHYVCQARQAIPAPAALPDDQLGCVWLPFLTAWGCLVWRQNLQPGAIVALPAASSAVAIAAGQIVRHLGGVAIGLTTSPGKVEQLQAMPGCAYDHIVVTAGKGGAWGRDLKALTDGHGIDVFFDPVAAGEYLDTEIKCLAPHGVIWVYGLLGEIGPVDVTPLIRKHAAIRGWAVGELAQAGPSAFTPGYRHILDGFADGTYTQELHRTFPLSQAAEAHRYMERGTHVGKMALIP